MKMRMFRSRFTAYAYHIAPLYRISSCFEMQINPVFVPLPLFIADHFFDLFIKSLQMSIDCRIPIREFLINNLSISIGRYLDSRNIPILNSEYSVTLPVPGFYIDSRMKVSRTEFTESRSNSSTCVRRPLILLGIKIFPFNKENSR